MEDVREARLQSERRSLLIDRIATFAQILEETDLESQVRTAEWELKPHLADLVLLPPVRAILDDPDDEQLPSEAVTFFRDNIQAMRNHWYDSIKDKLTDKFCEAVTLHGDTDCMLDLAITVFSCNECGKEVPLRFPGLLAHPCFRPGTLYTWRGELYTNTISEIASILKVPDAFVLDEVSVDCTAVEAIRAIVEACGLDPLRATQEDLERCETRLYCARCQTEDEDGWIQVQACDWLSAVRSPQAICFRCTTTHVPIHSTSMANTNTVAQAGPPNGGYCPRVQSAMSELRKSAYGVVRTRSSIITAAACTADSAAQDESR